MMTTRALFFTGSARACSLHERDRAARDALRKLAMFLRVEPRQNLVGRSDA